MRYKSIFFMAILSCLALFTSCVDTKLTKDLYDQWWPVHASGSFQSEYFTAKWNGALNKRGGIEVTYQSTNNPNLNYKEFVFYPAIEFSKSKGYCTFDIKTLDITQSKYIKFQVKDGKLYLEKTNDAGRGTGEFGEGKDISFLSENEVKIGDVTYQRYSYYREQNPLHSTDLGSGDRIPVMICL